MKLLVSILLGAFLITACSSPEKKDRVDVGQKMQDKEYSKIYDAHTKNQKKYDGFHQLYDVTATLISSDLQSAILQRRSDAYLWDETTAQSEREKMFQENTNSTKFILAMYTPNTRLNRLSRPNTIWKTYLTVDGRRYDGKIKKVKGPMEQIKSIYPTANRFTRIYEVVFEVPLSNSENGDSLFTITSELGSVDIKYASGKVLN